jgi:uncharacterized protein YndB with AHSA1/START domain
MTTQTMFAPVRKTVRVSRPVDEAFRLFTERIATWWPLPTHSVAGERAAAVVLEPREGGRIYERAEDGTIAYWGEVVVFEPPRRLVLAWQPNPDAPAPTEVEVTFAPDADGTRVDLEHRGWERLGDRAELARTEYDTGWDGILGVYAAAGHENGLAIASLVLGVTSVVLPIGPLAAPFAIAMGVVGRRRARQGARHGGLAVAGLTLGVVGLVLWTVIFVLVVGGLAVDSGGGIGTGEIVTLPEQAP